MMLYHTIIYSICHPMTGEIVYVGQTNNIVQRFSNHCCKSGGNKKMKEWLLKLRKKGLKPDYNIEIIIDRDNLGNYWEQWHIAYYKKLGYKLFNEIEWGNFTVTKSPPIFISPYHPISGYMALENNGIGLGEGGLLFSPTFAKPVLYEVGII